MSLQSGLDRLAIYTVTRQGLGLARRLEQSLPGTIVVYVSEKYAATAPEHYVRFKDKIQPVVDSAWGQHDAHIFIGAAGIAVRLIAPHILDKRFDPGVVVMDIAGQFAIALCSGHLGGANALCHSIAEAVGAIAVVTTGTDVNGTLAPDVLAKQLGAAIENWDALKVVSGALVDGQRVGVLVEPGIVVPDLSAFAAKNVHLTQDLTGFDAGIGVTTRVLETTVPTIWLRPPALVLGIGCNSGTSEAEIAAEVDSVLADHGLSSLSVREVATVEKKKDEPGLVAFCNTRKLPLRWYDNETITRDAPPFEPSETVFRFLGVFGVSEPAAMLAAGATRLVVPKQKRGNLTVAVARVGDRP